MNPSPDRDLDCAKWMLERVRSAVPEFIEPSPDAWALDIQLMREHDGRSYKQIVDLVSWMVDNRKIKDDFSCAKLASNFNKWASAMNRPKHVPAMAPKEPEPELPPDQIGPSDEYYSELKKAGFDPRKRLAQHEAKHAIVEQKPSAPAHMILRQRSACDNCRKTFDIVCYFKLSGKKLCVGCAITNP